MSPEKPDPKTSPDRNKPGNHSPARPGHEPDPRTVQPEQRPGDPGLQGGAADAGAGAEKGGSRA